MSTNRKITRLQERKNEEATKKLNRATDGKLRPEWVSRRPEEVSWEEFSKQSKEDEAIYKYLNELEIRDFKKRFSNFLKSRLEDEGLQVTKTENGLIIERGSTQCQHIEK